MQQNARPFRIPQSQTERSPDTTVEEIMPLTQRNTQRTNISSESLLGQGVQVPMPTTREEIKELLPNDPLKRFRLEKLIKEAMPSTVRKRKFEEIMKSNETDGMTESQQERMVRSLLQEEIKHRLYRHTGGNKRRRHSTSSVSSQGSLSESIGRAAPPVVVPPRDAVSQTIQTPVITHVSRRRPITDSLSSSDTSSNGAQRGSPMQNQQTPTSEPVRPPTPDAELLPPPSKPPAPRRKPRQMRPQTPDQEVPTTSTATRRNRTSNEGTAHTNMGAPSRPSIPFPITGANGVFVRSSKEIHGA